jgi:hypothetical protein
MSIPNQKPRSREPEVAGRPSITRAAPIDSSTPRGRPTIRPSRFPSFRAGAAIQTPSGSHLNRTTVAVGTYASSKATDGLRRIWLARRRLLGNQTGWLTWAHGLAGLT